MKIQIKPGLEIGDGCPPFIIAEVGSNWRTFEDCSESITKAKQCGADAVKFQAYDYSSLYGVKHKKDDEAAKEFMRSAHTLFADSPASIVNRTSLPLSWLPKLKEKADAVGIEFMCSAFSPELIDAVDPWVNIHKVASSEMCHVRMLEKLRDIGKPVILSTGAQTHADISMARKVLAGTPTILMYCVAAYPANEVNLGIIETLRSEFDGLVGYSDHSTDVCVLPRAAMDRGACVIEKHVNFVGASGPDTPHSLNTDQFKRMVDTLRGQTTSAIGPTRDEQSMVTRHKRRLIATVDIPEGGRLIEGTTYGIYRSLKDDTHAFSPFMVDQINGKIARKAISAGDGIGPGDV